MANGPSTPELLTRLIADNLPHTKTVSSSVMITIISYTTLPPKCTHAAISRALCIMRQAQHTQCVRYPYGCKATLVRFQAQTNIEEAELPLTNAVGV